MTGGRRSVDHPEVGETHNFTARIPVVLWKRLVRVAKQNDRSVQGELRAALHDWCEFYLGRG